MSDKYIPHKVTRCRCSLPWITTSIRRLIRRRDKLYRKFKQSKSEDIYEDFKTVKHTIQKEMRKAYWSYINNIISLPPDNSIVHNQKKFWSFIKSLKKDSTGIQVLEVDGNQLTTSADKAEALNSHFKSVFTNEPSTSLPNKGPTPYPIMPSIEISVDGVAKQLFNLNVHKPPDQISARFLKECYYIITPTLSLIFQLSLETGTIPDDWKRYMLLQFSKVVIIPVLITTVQYH